MSFSIGGELAPGTVDSCFFADAGEHVCKRPPVGMVVKHIVHGDQRHLRIARDANGLDVGAELARGGPQARVLLDNLPGFPDNVTRGADGRYWTGFTKPRSKTIDDLARKPFLRALTGSNLDAIGAATLAAELFAVRAGADWIRTHDVRALRDGLCIERALVDADSHVWVPYDASPDCVPPAVCRAGGVRALDPDGKLLFDVQVGGTAGAAGPDAGALLVTGRDRARVVASAPRTGAWAVRRSPFMPPTSPIITRPSRYIGA